MAISKGKEISESLAIKRYIGVGSVRVLKVNPIKEELEQIYGTVLENAPTYIGETEVNGTKVPQVRISFVVATNEEKTGINMTTTINFFINRYTRYNRDNTKIQVINKYGEVAWLPVEDAKAGRVPENLSWFEAADFRPAYIGEEELTGFIKALLNIPAKSYRNKTTGEVVTIPNKEDAEARFDHIEDYFKSDFKEIREAVSSQPKNEVKALFGVRTTDDGKQYQAVYTQKFLKNNVRDYSALEKDLESRKANGSYPTTEFQICDLKEYNVEETKFDAPAAVAAPLSDSGIPWD